MAYASPMDLEQYFGQSRLREWYGHLTESELVASYSRALNSASARMNGTFQRAGYSTPIDFTQVVVDELRVQLQEQLRTACCALAIAAGIGGTVDAPEGAKAAVGSSEKWLVRILNGDESLVGLSRGREVAREILSGRVGVVIKAGEPSALSSDLFSRFDSCFRFPR